MQVPDSGYGIRSSGTDLDTQVGPDPWSDSETMLITKVEDGPDPDSKWVPDPFSDSETIRFLNLGPDPDAKWVPEPCSINRRRNNKRKFLSLSSGKVLKLGHAEKL